MRLVRGFNNKVGFIFIRGKALQGIYRKPKTYYFFIKTKIQFANIGILQKFTFKHASGTQINHLRKSVPIKVFYMCKFFGLFTISIYVRAIIIDVIPLFITNNNI